jgi:hypothetical protein
MEPTASVRAFNDQYLLALETGVRASPLDLTPCKSQFGKNAHADGRTTRFAHSSPSAPKDLETRDTRNEISEVVLTWRDGLKKLCQIEFGRKVTAKEFEINFSEVWQRLSTLPIVKGRPVTKPPPL